MARADLRGRWAVNRVLSLATSVVLELAVHAITGIAAVDGETGDVGHQNDLTKKPKTS